MNNKPVTTILRMVTKSNAFPLESAFDTDLESDLELSSWDVDIVELTSINSIGLGGFPLILFERVSLRDRGGNCLSRNCMWRIVELN